MLQRAIFLYVFFVVAVVSTGAAVWQRLETNLREEQLSDTARLLVAARSEARELQERANTAERRVRLLEKASPARAIDDGSDQAESAAPSDEEAKLRAELAAARQQLSAAETAIEETEDRLASEIADHAALKVKAQELSEEVSATRRTITAIEGKTAADGKAAAVDSRSATETTGSLPEHQASDDSASAPTAGAPAIADTTAEPAAAPPVAIKKPAKRTPKPVIRAVKPIGSPFEPML